LSIDVSVTTRIYFVSEGDFYNTYWIPMYGNLTGAINYFSTRLNTQPWDDATRDERLKAIRQSTRLIDRLNFVGTQSVADQPLQFPRGGDTEVPSAIELACYEIALKLLDGVDPDMEIDNLGARSLGFDGVRNTYDRSIVLEHLRNGIPSATAWVYLKPYMHDPLTLRLSRVG
jgi:hypothetical protein